MTTTTPVLDLSAPVANRAQVKIATTAHPTGEIFELRGELELGLVTIAKIQTLFERASEIASNGQGDEAQAEQMERWINECFDLIFHREVDAETRAGIPDLRKMQVVEFFLDSCLTPASERVAKKTPRAKSTGAK